MRRGLATLNMHIPERQDTVIKVIYKKWDFERGQIWPKPYIVL